MVTKLSRIGTSQLYVSNPQPHAAPGQSSGTFCFLSATNLGKDSIGLIEAGALPGVFALAGRDAAGQFTSLEALMRGHLQANPAEKAHALLWTSNGSTLHYQVLVKADGTVAGGALLPLWDFYSLPEESKLRTHFTYWIPEGSTVVFRDDGITLAHKGLELRVNYYPNGSIGVPPKDGRLDINVSLGPQCGCLSLQLGHGSSLTLLQALGPHVGYFWTAGMSEKEVRSQLLSTEQGMYKDVAMLAELDPFSSPHSRCRFTSSNAVLPSTLLDVKSRGVMLSPQTDGNTAYPAEVYFEQGNNAYPSLRGAFAVHLAGRLTGLAGTEGIREIMAGSSGTELFQIGRDGYDGIRFFEGGHAYLQPATLDAPPQLTDKRTTAWMAPCKLGQRAASVAGGYSYVAQSEAQPLSSRRQVAAGRLESQQHKLAFDPAPMTVLDSACLPILPMRPVPGKNAADAQRIDRDILSPNRTVLAAQAAAPSKLATLSGTAKLAEPTWITTPQGLLVAIDQDNQWQAIQIAASEPSSGAIESWMVSIDRPQENGLPVKRWALQEALSRSDVFVVITPMPAPHQSEPAFGKVNLSMKINGWEFTKEFKLDSDGVTPSAGAVPLRRPVMVIKLGSGSIKSLAANPAKWSMARSFNTDPAQAARDVQSAVESMYTLSQGESPIPVPGNDPKLKRIPDELMPYYASLHGRLISSEWNGVVVFNADAPAIPADAGVIIGGKQEPNHTFWVPMLGIDLNRLAVDSQGIAPGKASAFAAIHDHDPEPLKEEGDGDFEFKLRNMNAVFENTELRCFLASMQLRLGSYFGAKTVTKGGSSRLLDISGRYEQHGGAGGSERYLFRALGVRTITFDDSGLLATLTVNRVDVTSSREKDGPVSRFGIFGELAFTDKFTSFTSVKKISFDNAGLIMKHDTFRVDAGQVRVDFKKGEGSGSGDSLMGSFPFTLSGLRWSGGSSHITLPEIGFVPLDIGLPHAAVNFDFALEFDLNLGTLGKLADAAQFLKGKILVGWQESSGEGVGGWTVGFRFDGGSGPLDIGVNGVLRLRADKVSLKNYTQPHAGIGLALINPQLEVMGYKIPKEPHAHLIAFIPNSSKSQLGWAWADTRLDAGPVALSWFVLGQRMKVAGDIGVHASLPDILEASRTTLGNDEPDVGKLYDENAGWALITEGKLGPLATRLVFMDEPGIYGLGIDIPALANVDVLYRRLASDLGVFAGEITPAVRSFEMGAANVTLPIFSFEAYTNGNWSLNIGFNGNDFSRGTTVQVLPFLGSGGVRFSKADWRSSYVLYGPDTPPTLAGLYQRLNLDPVIEFSMAARVGIGKEIDEGIFQAGVALSVYGIFEGALAVPRLGPSGPSRYIKLTGTAGILLEIFGSVNFAVISAAVCIRAWIEQGLTLESWQPITIHAAAGVSVHVRFVVAEFSVFGHHVVIAIHFSFAYTARFSIELAAKLDGDMPNLPGFSQLSLPSTRDSDTAAEPLAWETHQLDGGKQDLSVSISAEAMLGVAKPVMLPMLLASHVQGVANPLASLTVDLLRWALRLSRSVQPGAADPATVTLTHLRDMQARLRPPKKPQKISLSRWGAKPLNYAVVRAFLCSRVTFKLVTVRSLLGEQLLLCQAAKLNAPERPSGIQLPWFGEVDIYARTKAGSETRLRELYGAQRQDIDPDWEAELYDRLGRTRPDYKPEPSARLKSSYLRAGLYEIDISPKPAVDAIVEDWAAALVLGITQRAIELFNSKVQPTETNLDPELDFRTLCSALLACDNGHDSIALQVAQQASAFLHHGARVPTPPGSAKGDLALAELLKLEIGFDELPPGPDVYLHFRAAPADLFNDTADLDPFEGNAATAALTAAGAALKARPIAISLEVEAPAYLPRRLACDKKIPLAPAAKGGQAVSFLPFPSWISMKLASDTQGTKPLALSLQIEQEGGTIKPVPAPRWASKIDVRLRQLSGTEPSTLADKQAVYAIAGVDERVRAVLTAIRDSASKATIRSVRLAYRPQVDDPENTSPDSLPLQFVEGKSAFVFVSNLSQEAAPAHELAAMPLAADDDKPVFAYLSDHDALVKLMLMASVVNGPGFQLGVTGDDPFKKMFDRTRVVTVSIIIEAALEAHPAAPQAFMDGLMIDAGDLGNKDAAVFLAPGHLSARSNIPDGQVALLVRRPNALPPNDPTPDGPLRDAKALAARYNLVDYAIDGDAVFSAVTRGEVSAVGVDLTEKELEDLRDAPGNEPTEWRHRILVPLSGITKDAANGVAIDPYGLVGTDVSKLVKPGLRDGAGHLLADNMLRVTGWSNAVIKYRTPIACFEEFPGAASAWSIGIEGGTRLLSLELTWAIKDLIPPVKDHPEIPASRLAALCDEYVRLAQMSKGPGFTVCADFTIGGARLATIDLTSAFKAWVAKIAAELATAQPQPQHVKLSVPLDPLPGTLSFQPQEVKLALTLARDPAHCDDTPNSDTDIQAITSIVSASCKTGDHVDWANMAASLHEVFGDSLTLLRRVGAAGARGTLWVLPGNALSKLPSEVKAAGATFLAPAPLAKAFMSGSVDITDLSGIQRNMDAADVDLNVLGGNAAAMLERFLSPRTAQTLCRMSGDYFSRMAAAKRQFALAMTDRLEPVFASSATKEELQEAIDKFRNAAGADLRSAFGLTVGTHVKLDAQPAQDIYLYGGTAVGADASLYKLTPMRIPLGAAGIKGAFTFVAGWSQPDDGQTAVLEGALRFTPRYVEIRDVKSSFNDYVPSDWYEIIWRDPDKERDITFMPANGKKIWEIPLPLREVPPTPTVVRHVGETCQSASSAQSIEDFVTRMRTWQYHVDLAVPGRDQDTAYVKVSFTRDTAFGLFEQDELFKALVAYSGNEAELLELLSRLESGVPGSDLEVSHACELFTRIGAALSAQRAALAFAEGANGLKVQMKSKLRDKEWQLHWSADPNPLKDVAARLMPFPSGSEQAMPDPVPPTGTTAGQANYALSNEVKDAIRGGAGLSVRRLSVSNLDILEQSIASTIVHARRNEELAGEKVMPVFVFDTTEVKTADAIVPHVRLSEDFDMTRSVAAANPVSFWLEKFEKALFSNNDQIRSGCSVDARAALRCPFGANNEAFFSYPMSSMLGVPASDNQWISAWAPDLEASIASIDADARKTAQLSFDIKVYSTLNLDKPVISLANLNLPLSKVSVGNHVGKLYEDNAALRPVPQPKAIAEILFAETWALEGDPAEMTKLHQAVAEFALTYRGEGLKAGRRPSASELGLDDSLTRWDQCLAASLAVSQAQRLLTPDSWRALTLWTAQAGGTQPAPGVEPWFDGVLDTDSPLESERIAGPFNCRDLAAGLPVGVPLYLWAAKLKVGKA